MGRSNIHAELHQGQESLNDPGDAGTIIVDKDLQMCEMVSGESAETRTLKAPTRAGIRLALRLLTDGGGEIIVHAAEGFNRDEETDATFADAGDLLSLISVTTTTGYRWEVIDGNIGVTLA
uniref:Uncharacterized protein n=1 Tax=viral metagenome TaxID=1070528 RepID=A0A6M3L0T9_9ZZZZ